MTEHAWEERDVLDRDQLLSLRELQPPDEPDVVAELVTMFLEDSGVRFSRARDALARGDANALRLEVHSLRGTAALVGADRLRAVAAAVEQGARTGDTAGIGAVFDALAAALQDVRVALASFAAADAAHVDLPDDDGRPAAEPLR